MTNAQTALSELSARGITTLEQLVASKSGMRKPQRIDSQKAVEELLARSSARAGRSYKPKMVAPDPSVQIVLDGKRVAYREIANLDGKPLDFVATTLKTGEPALVAFSDLSIMKNHHLRQFNGTSSALSTDIDNALRAGGLQPSVMTRSIALGVKVFEDINYGGSSWTLAPEDYVPDLTEFDEGLGIFGGDWNDKISSLQMGRCYCQVWSDINEGGLTHTFYQDVPDLGVYGWNDIASGIWAAFTNG